uniref:Large ribosomal subunit protein bL28m n=1 Tax=Latimeria chalumnae TaxID=7897 RepID=H3ANY3_LATCH
MPLHKVPPLMWEALKLKQGIYSRLPAHYLKSLQETQRPTPVHFRPLGVEYRANPKTGQRERVQDVPIPLYYPPASQEGLWGGEGWIAGYRYANNDKLSTRLKKVWKPQVFKRELYSEILDTKFTIPVTMRTLDLIDAAYSFDLYILKVSAGGWETPRRVKFATKTLFCMEQASPQLQNPFSSDLCVCLSFSSIYFFVLFLSFLKEFVIPEEEAEWVGLSLEEAVEKQRLLEKKEPVPLFKVFTEELLQQLAVEKLSEPEVRKKKS